nr:MAG TPA: hypothetical protein [Caudoviricetes sp.]
MQEDFRICQALLRKETLHRIDTGSSYIICEHGIEH